MSDRQVALFAYYLGFGYLPAAVLRGDSFGLHFSSRDSLNAMPELVVDGQVPVVPLYQRSAESLACCRDADNR